jgi:hypothetical protein
MISAYTTTRNAVSMEYPFEESIKSMLGFADEVVVVDTSDGTDNTLSRLETLSFQDSRVVVVSATDQFDWSAPNHGVFDGQTKALARSMCRGLYLWQFDCDEIIHELDAPKVRSLLEQTNNLRDVSLIALPVTEFWGSQGKVRLDVNSWKWRLSYNSPDITHGIPSRLRKMENGLLYAMRGTDGCDYISKTTGEPVPCANFVTTDSESTRVSACYNEKLVPLYQGWFENITNAIPGVYHYSWFSIERKIKQYREFWTGFWKSLYNETANLNWNPFFGNMPWVQVTDEMISQKAKELESKTGGWIFHSEWDGSRVNNMTTTREHPAVMKDWIKKHS